MLKTVYSTRSKMIEAISLQQLDIFPTTCFITSIRPNSYNKEQLVSDMVHNYNISPKLNQWDVLSSIHHTYGIDDDELKSKSLICVNAEKYHLLSQYETVISNFVSLIRHKKHTVYQWAVNNFTINAEFMREHDHMDFANESLFPYYSFIHYVSFKDHGETVFTNPLSVQIYGTLTPASRELDVEDSKNSTFFQDWRFNTKEDEIIIFPSYLKHYVKSNVTKHPRITVAGNIKIDIGVK